MTGRFNIADFRLAETLLCGQAFRWRAAPHGWYAGVIGRRLVRLRQAGRVVEWATAPRARRPPLPCAELGATKMEGA
ncbi:hypothetical protein HQ590_08835, partial [bacterium]|nr:hypothetical protein [bacterium]